ncbi:MAG: Protein of unknown function (DUF4239) [Rhodobacteraceae bacterium HLUCCA12]|nr:MAG: Protein of unknown function (DUF4239) [Rhodobacteraceae bacterium HLUCCA12]
MVHLNDILGAFTLLGWIIAASIAALVAAFALLRLFHRRFNGEITAVPVNSFFGAVTTIWALVFGFVAADVWQANSNAAEAAVQERAALIRLNGMAEAEALDLPELENALHRYVGIVARNEWDGAGNSESAPEAETALQAIRLALLAAQEDGVPSVLLGKMITDFDELQDARTKRLAIGAGDAQILKWMLVIILTLMSMVAIAFVHRDKPRAGRTALKIFTVAAAAAFWLVLLHSGPYLGPVRLTSAEIAF